MKSWAMLQKREQAPELAGLVAYTEAAYKTAGVLAWPCAATPCLRPWEPRPGADGIASLSLGKER